MEWYLQGKAEELGEAVQMSLCPRKSHMDWIGREPGPPRQVVCYRLAGWLVDWLAMEFAYSLINYLISHSLAWCVTESVECVVSYLSNLFI
jgi:hypothetical protein